VKVIDTDRLVLRTFVVEDAEFLLRLLNEPSFLRFIGDRGVRSIDDAREYILNGPIESFDRHGFSLYVTELSGDGIPIGICGLLKRETLDDVDIGFAFLPEFWGNGYAYESASAVMRHARTELGLCRVVAITAPENHASKKVLEKIGMKFEGTIRLTDDGEDIELFAHEGLAKVNS
jgi:RimJ/RimL family protein N-acetyltransferase